MPNPQIVQLIPPALPPGYCFTDWPTLVQDIFNGAYGVIASSVGTGFNYGQGIPAVNNQDKPWIRLNPDNSPAGTYVFAYGTWVKEKEFPPVGPNDWRGIFVGSNSDLWNFDGGDGNDPSVTPPTPSTGAMYEVDPAFAARTIVGAGTLPIAGTVLAVGDLGGLDKVGLTVSELAPHTHLTVADQQTGQPNNIAWGSDGLGGGGGVGTTGTVYPGNDGLQSGSGSSYRPVKTSLANTGGDTSVTPIVVKPHENMPPFYTVQIIRRTIRKFYTI